jgi:hypothetical protein
MGIERLVEATANAIKKVTPGLKVNYDEATFAEFKDIVMGIKPGLRRSMENVTMAMLSEKPQLQRLIDSDRVTGKFDNLQTAIQTPYLGRAVRALGYTRLLMADEFFQTLIVHMEVGAQARRMALATENPNTPGKNYKSGTQDIADYISNAQKDYRHGAWARALTVARRATFQQPGHEKGAKEKFKKGLKYLTEIPVVGRWGIRFVFPFIGTPVNILAAGLEMSPLGIFALAHDHVRRIRNGESIDRSTVKHTTQMLGAAAVLWMIYNNDDDEPQFTGSNDHLGWNAQRTAKRTIPPRSMKIPFAKDDEGNALYWDMSRWEPFIQPISLTVDIANAWKRGESAWESFTNIPKTMLVNLFDTIATKSYFDTIADVQKIMGSETEEAMMRKIAKFYARRAASYVPNVYKHWQKHKRPLERELRVLGSTREEFWGNLIKRTIQSTELMPWLYKDNVKYDGWGRAVEAGEGLPFVGPWFTRMILPGKIKALNLFRGDEIIRWWNINNVESRSSIPDYDFALPETTFINPRTGKKVSMTNEQYEEMSRVKGTLQRYITEFATIRLTDAEVQTPTDDILEFTVKSSRTEGSALASEILKDKWIRGEELPTDLKALAKERYDDMIRRKSETIGERAELLWDARKYESEAEWEAATEAKILTRDKAVRWLKANRITQDVAWDSLRRRTRFFREMVQELQQQ